MDKVKIKRIICVVVTLALATLYLAWCIFSGAFDVTVLIFGKYVAGLSMFCGETAIIIAGALIDAKIIKKDN